MNYMENLLRELRNDYGVREDAIERIRAELVKSFKNGIARGRGEGTTPRRTGSRSTDSGRAVR